MSQSEHQQSRPLGSLAQIDAQYCPKYKSRWSSYGVYRMLLCAWLINDYTVVFASTELSHEGLYLMTTLYIVTVIVIGAPVLFTEICLAQYANCDLITVWNFCPILRGVGYCMVYTTFLKTVHGVVLTSWYLEYSLYAAMDPPPWTTCDDFTTSRCLVKKVNKTVFQHCLEMLRIFEQDCGMKTASNFVFTEAIGNTNTLNKWPTCVYKWKMALASGTLVLVVFLLSLRREKNIQIVMRGSLIYSAIAISILFCMSLSTEGSWQIKNPSFSMGAIELSSCVKTIRHGILSTGTGLGVTLCLTRDVSFRSPANMTAVTASLISMLISINLAIISFNCICAITFYHSEEEYVIEESEHFYFDAFASMSEAISYMGNSALWGFLWFSAIFVCNFQIEWLLFLSLQSIIISYLPCAHNHAHIASFILSLTIFLMSLLFFCSDLTVALFHTIEVCQLISLLLFAIGVYWVYGFRKHRNDILFMIGVKASYFWNVSWVICPLAISFVLYFKIREIEETPSDNISYIVKSIDMHFNKLLFFVLLGGYFIILSCGTLIEVIYFIRHDDIRNLLYPTDDWGPADRILKKSRQMFVPEVMTREFLYRQVRIRGLCEAKRNYQMQTLSSRKESGESELECKIDCQEWDV